MNANSNWLETLTDKSGRRLLPILEDMRKRDNAVLICSFGGDDTGAPLSAHLAENHGAQIALGLEQLAEAGNCIEVILYAAALDLTALTQRLSGKLGVMVKAGPPSPILREPTALYSVLDTGVVRAGNAEEDYSRTFLSYGYQGRPTLVVDAETAYAAYRLSEGLTLTKHIALISGGTEIHEVDLGIPLGTILKDATGVKYLLQGGVCGAYFDPAAADATAVTYRYLFDSVELLGADACVVSRTAEIYSAVKELSCQKCVLCREGSWQLSTILRDITEGKAGREDIALVEDITPLIAAGALCGFGREMVQPALTAISLYRGDFEAHITAKACAAGKCRGLMSYLIDPVLCTGCGECLEVCPEEAIEGEDGFIHMIDEMLCIKCGKCLPVCPEGAIKFGGDRIKVPKKLTKVGKFR